MGFIVRKPLAKASHQFSENARITFDETPVPVCRRVLTLSSLGGHHQTKVEASGSRPERAPVPASSEDFTARMPRSSRFVHRKLLGSDCLDNGHIRYISSVQFLVHMFWIAPFVSAELFRFRAVQSGIHNLQVQFLKS